MDRYVDRRYEKRLLDATDPDLQALSAELSKKWDWRREATAWATEIFNDPLSYEPEWFSFIKACVLSLDANKAYTEEWGNLGQTAKNSTSNFAAGNSAVRAVQEVKAIVDQFDHKCFTRDCIQANVREQSIKPVTSDF